MLIRILFKSFGELCVPKPFCLLLISSFLYSRVLFPTGETNGGGRVKRDKESAEPTTITLRMWSALCSSIYFSFAYLFPRPRGSNKNLQKTIEPSSRLIRFRSTEWAGSWRKTEAKWTRSWLRKIKRNEKNERKRRNATNQMDSRKFPIIVWDCMNSYTVIYGTLLSIVAKLLAKNMSSISRAGNESEGCERKHMIMEQRTREMNFMKRIRATPSHRTEGELDSKNHENLSSSSL